MEGGDIYRATNSLRGSLRRSIRNSSVEVFSHGSSREEDDEEALKWAALEKLPTYDRLRKGILASASKGVASEIDVTDLGFQQRQALLDRLVKVAEEDNEKFLLKLKNRIERVGIDMPTIEVRFEHINVEAEAHVGGRALPSFVNATLGVLEGIVNFLHIIPSGKKKFNILKDVSGVIKPSRMTLLLGPPSSGKTTLLLALAGKLDPALKVSGRVTYNGHGLNEFIPQRTAAYISQHDLHIGEMTVRETLAFSARFQGVGHSHDMLAELSRREKEANIKPDPDLDVFMKHLKSLRLFFRRSLKVMNKVTGLGDPFSYQTVEVSQNFIEEVMELVELNPIRNALVGLPGVNGLSTEQRKRLTIAVELVANPSIIFMDEPTSGLDARAAAIVMRTVRNTVDTGRTVVCTIHQPSIDIFEAFDELFLMKRGGQEIYVGPLGRHSSHLIKYFEEIEGVSKIKDGYNPATWMLEVTTSAQELAMGVDFTEIYRNSDLYRRNKALISELSTPSPGSKDLYFPTQYSTSFFTQCVACFWKQRWSYWRNPPYTAVRFFFTTFIGLMFGTIFWDLGTKTERQQDLFNAIGSMYAAVLFLGVQNSLSVQPVVAIERTVFYRERAAGMYSALPYAFAQVLIEIPYVFAQAAVYSILVYSMIGFEWTAAKFFWNLFFMVCTLLYFTYYGMMAVAMTPNHHIASIVSASFYSIWNLFSGFIMPRPSMPVWWRWYFWGCPVAWTLYGLVASQFGDIQKTMVDRDGTVEEFIRSYFGFKHDFLGEIAAGIVGWTVLFAFFFAFGIKVFNFQKR
ncbi:hypothetical protein Tsubulata_014816 [Turnera subulata]|uniref:ABC transporter domain-containing protein n=1 Tax=Turnera subulata TaxID=218843 RepID=A0A9Q0FWN9_9ROSI|nr:hypothetical protein Tsubulata_014816 [Turnera subulata]